MRYNAMAMAMMMVMMMMEAEAGVLRFTGRLR
jgi:hypothetical protein